MTRRQLEHIIRAAAALTEHKIFVVVGSQAILLQHPKAPPEMLISDEADIYPFGIADDKRRSALSDLIDGALGIDSQFHVTFGYYADGVGPETATLPKNWDQRAFRLKNEFTGGATAICPEAHDLAAAKLIAGREKDVDWVQSGVSSGMIQKPLLEQRIRDVNADPAVVKGALDRLAALRGRFEDPQPEPPKI